MMKQMLKRTGALLLSLCLTLSVWGVLTPLPAAAETSGEYEYRINDDNTATITKYLGSGGDVTIPDALDGHTVTEIGIGYHSFYGAFDGCTRLTSVIIPDSVITIGDHAFYCCTGLTSVTIGNNVTTIDDYSFCGCTGLTSVIIPNSVTKLGQYAFDGCIGLTSFTVSANNPNYSSKDGVLFNKNQTKLIEYPQGKSGSYTIPGSVTTIGGSAFSGCSELTSIIIPDSVTTISNDSFAWCRELTSVDIPDSVTEIGNSAFYCCTGLTSIHIPDSVTTIGPSAFLGCTGLTSVDIGDSMTTIGWGAFLGCTGLTSIIVGANNPNYSSKDGVLFNKDQTELIQYALGKSGSYTIPDSVTEIGQYAFYGCTGLTSVDIPNSVTTIGEEAFSDCTGLTSVDIPDSVTAIGWGAFSDCTGLTSITIPDSVTEIDDYAFSGCYNLTIYGKVGSYAETYAKENRIPFGTKATNQETGIVVEGTAETLPDDAVLNAKQTASGEDAATYEITLTQNGQPVQPTGEVTVKIPLPESMKDKRITVYRIEANGSRTNMNATVQNGYVVFVTDHFSQYVLEASDALLGDIDGDGKVSVTDALAILRMAVGLSAPVDNADMDVSGSVTVTDALTALRIAVGLA